MLTATSVPESAAVSAAAVGAVMLRERSCCAPEGLSAAAFNQHDRAEHRFCELAQLMLRLIVAMMTADRQAVHTRAHASRCCTGNSLSTVTKTSGGSCCM